MAEAHEKALIDPLTQVFNRNKFTLALEAEIAKNAENYQPLTLIMLDIDWFKKVNDTYGHDVGDEVLIEFANIIKNTIGYNQLLARYGGEEFIIALHHTNPSNALNIAEKCRLAIENIQVNIRDQQTIKVTASFGVDFSSHNKTLEQTIRNADDALYISKQSGRNQVKIFENRE